MNVSEHTDDASEHQPSQKTLEAMVAADLRQTTLAEDLEDLCHQLEIDQ